MSKLESEMIKDTQGKISGQENTAHCSPAGLQVPNEGLMELKFKDIRNLEVKEITSGQSEKIMQDAHTRWRDF